MTFLETLQNHLDAIQSRDLASFVETVTQGEAFSFLLPNGAYMSGRDEFIAFTRDWFADPDWQFSCELIRTVQRPELAMALLLVTYDDHDAAGVPYQLTYYLNLLFAQEGERWALVHDQNTLVKEMTR